MSENPEDNLVVEEPDSRKQMVAGSAWMTAGSIFSRILGAIYIIPWGIWFGSFFFQGNALYSKGYNIYSFFLIAAIAGVPSAIAKQVAHYNALNEYGIGVRLYKRGLILALATGVISAGLLYFGAPLFADGDQNVIPVLHSLAWAVLIIPWMSLTRGYFQGYQQMAPSAISQFAEQLVRVIYMLVTAFLIMRVWHGNWVDAVSQSTFAAFVGALAGLAILGYYYWRRRDEFRSLVAHSNNELVVPASQLYTEILQQAAPFIVLGAGITIFQLIDQFTFFSIMKSVYHYSQFLLNDLFAMFAANANKLIMIVVSLASALAVTSVPMLSSAYTRGDHRSIREQITNVLMLFEFVMFPSALGMAAIAGPLNIVFYGHDHQGLATMVLVFSSLLAILLGQFTVISALMQGISQNMRAVRYFAIGTLVKLIAQWPLVALFGTFGPLMSSGLGFIVANVLILRWMRHEYDMSSLASGKTNQILLFSLITFVIAWAVSWVLQLVIPDNKIGSFIIVLVAATAGGGAYLYAVLKTRLADGILGERVAGLRRHLRIK